MNQSTDWILISSDEDEDHHHHHHHQTHLLIAHFHSSQSHLSIKPIQTNTTSTLIKSLASSTQPPPPHHHTLSNQSNQNETLLNPNRFSTHPSIYQDTQDQQLMNSIINEHQPTPNFLQQFINHSQPPIKTPHPSSSPFKQLIIKNPISILRRNDPISPDSIEKVFSENENLTDPSYEPSLDSDYELEPHEKVDRIHHQLDDDDDEEIIPSDLNLSDDGNESDDEDEGIGDLTHSENEAESPSRSKPEPSSSIKRRKLNHDLQVEAIEALHPISTHESMMLINRFKAQNQLLQTQLVSSRSELETIRSKLKSQDRIHRSSNRKAKLELSRCHEKILELSFDLPQSFQSIIDQTQSIEQDLLFKNLKQTQVIQNLEQKHKLLHRLAKSFFDQKKSFESKSKQLQLQLQSLQQDQQHTFHQTLVSKDQLIWDLKERIRILEGEPRGEFNHFLILKNSFTLSIQDLNFLLFLDAWILICRLKIIHLPTSVFFLLLWFWVSLHISLESDEDQKNLIMSFFLF